MPLLASAPSSVWFSAEVFREFRKRWADGQGYASQFHKRDSGLESETACLIGQCVPERRAKADPEESRHVTQTRVLGEHFLWMTSALPMDDIIAEIGSHALEPRRPHSWQSIGLLTAQDGSGGVGLDVSLRCVNNWTLTSWEWNVDIFTLPPYRPDYGQASHQHEICILFSA